MRSRRAVRVAATVAAANKRRKDDIIVLQDGSDSSDCNGPVRQVRPKVVAHRDYCWMSSTEFESHFENLWSTLSEAARSAFTYLDSMWFTLYFDDFYRENVLTWIKKKEIFSKKYVIVPIVHWSHWCLLILCNFNESLQSESNTPCMLLLDSLQGAGSNRFEAAIRKFVSNIFKAEDRPEDSKKVSGIPFLVPKVPQQRSAECGSFVLYFISLFVRNAPENFSVDDGYPYFMKEDWFHLEDLHRFLKELDPSPTLQLHVLES